MARPPDQPRLRLVGSDPGPGPSAGGGPSPGPPATPPQPPPVAAGLVGGRVGGRVDLRPGANRPPVPPRPVDPARTLRPAARGPRRPDEEHRAAFSVTRENRQAALRRDLDPTDPRWVLAVRVASQMEGSLLTPERRARVMRTAHQLGIRPFDAGIVIAMVQDRLRRGGSLGELSPQLQMLAVPITRRPAGSIPIWARFLLAITLATAGVLLVVRWLLAA